MRIRKEIMCLILFCQYEKNLWIFLIRMIFFVSHFLQRFLYSFFSVYIAKDNLIFIYFFYSILMGKANIRMKNCNVTFSVSNDIAILSVIYLVINCVK